MPKKIYFYSPSMQMYHRDLSDTSGWVNAVPIYLSAHLKRTRPDLVNQIEWTGYSLEPLDQEALINDINSNAIDLLLVSIFVWNQEHVYNNLKDIKQRINRPLKIIVGGPSVDPFRNKNYFVEHPEIDYAVYAQGEEAFANVLDHLINDKKLSLLSSKNLAWQQDGQMKLGDFEFLRLKEGSPYMESADVTQWIADQTINNPKYKDIRFWFPYESSKGCPYDCTYCDWTSGLTHKVYHRQFNIEDEFNFLGTMGFTGFAFVDANFGQHRQDIDITQTMIKLNKEKGYGFEIVAINMSKLKTKEYSQMSVRCEFFADDIGWVPADPGSALYSKKNKIDPDMCFGIDYAAFFTQHVDPNIDVQNPLSNKRINLVALQTPAYWITTQSTTIGPVKVTQDWKVTKREKKIDPVK